MLRVREFSETAMSPQTASSSSSLVMSLCGLRSRKSRTRNAFGSTASTSPSLARLNSRSRTSISAKLKMRHLCRVMKTPAPHDRVYPQGRVHRVNHSIKAVQVQILLEILSHRNVPVSGLDLGIKQSPTVSGCSHVRGPRYGILL